MNRIARHLTRLTLTTAVLAAGLTAQAAHAAEHGVRVVQLPDVVVIGKRIRVVELERVVVTARRMAPASDVVAQREVKAVKPLAKV